MLPGAYASAKPWDRRSPERLGINAQVDDLFHGRLDTGGPRGSRLTQHYNDARAGLRLSEALGPPFSRTARYKFSGVRFFHGRLDTGGPRGSRLTQHYNDARAGLRLTQHESDAPPQLNLFP